MTVGEHHIIYAGIAICLLLIDIPDSPIKFAISLVAGVFFAFKAVEWIKWK